MTILALMFMAFSFLVGYLGWGVQTGLILLSIATTIGILREFFVKDSIFGFFWSAVVFIPSNAFLIGFLIGGLHGGLIGITVLIGIILWIFAARYFLKD